jgi:UDP-N-acetyl-D-mannosaminuronic acid transferase (WecB/TagA/CpsF family)
LRFVVFIMSAAVASRASFSSQLAANEKPLTILTMGCTPSLVYGIKAELDQYPGLRTVAIPISDSKESEAEIANACKNNDLDAIFVGYGVRGNPQWFQRVQSVLAQNTKAPIVKHAGAHSGAVLDALVKAFPEKRETIMKR